MKILLMLPPLILLNGCVDLGDVGIHPEEKTYYVNQGKARWLIAFIMQPLKRNYHWNMMTLSLKMFISTI